MKSLENQSINKVGIVGKLVSLNLRDGNSKAGKPYVSARAVIRVNQSYLGVTETSDVQVSMFAMKFNKDGSTNSGYTHIMNEVANLKSIEQYGMLEADTVVARESSTSLRENTFTGRNGIVDSWAIDTRFLNKTSAEDKACFSTQIVVNNVREETDRDGETTGRAIVSGIIVKYGQAVDVVDFYVENPDGVSAVLRDFEPGMTVNVWGRVRVTTQEFKKTAVSSSWGEDAPEEISTRTVHELILTGSTIVDEDDNCYDTVEIKKAMNQRKADREQMMVANSAPAPKKKVALGWD